MGMNPTTMWTSGRSENKINRWPNNKRFLNTVMTPPPITGFVAPPKTNSCLSVLLATEKIALSGVQYSACAEMLRVLCQVKYGNLKND